MSELPLLLKHPRDIAESAIADDRKLRHSTICLVDEADGAPVRSILRWFPSQIVRQKTDCSPAGLQKLGAEAEKHFTYLESCGLILPNRRQYVDLAPSSSDDYALYTHVEYIKGIPLDLLRMSNDAKDRADYKRAGSFIIGALAMYEEWAIQEGRILYDISRDDQYLLLDLRQPTCGVFIDIDPDIDSAEAGSPGLEYFENNFLDFCADVANT